MPNLVSAPSAKPKLKLDDARRKLLVRRNVIQKRYDISPRTLDNWVKLRRIPYLKIGGMLFFKVADCDKALARFQIEAR